MYHIEVMDRMQSAVMWLGQNANNVILLDLSVPDGNGRGWIKTIKPENHDLPIFFITTQGDLPLTVEAMHNRVDPQSSVFLTSICGHKRSV